MLLRRGDFNPHEREARDAAKGVSTLTASPILIHTSVKLVTCAAGRRGGLSLNFNPHEREARDPITVAGIQSIRILIHTSVKLVTVAD